MTLLWAFLSNFFVVFLLGLQSKNVQQSRIVSAMMTSLGISVAQAYFIKFVASGDPVLFVTCAIGGCVGIACSIVLHDFLIDRKLKKGKIAVFGAFNPKNDQEAFVPFQILDGPRPGAQPRYTGAVDRFVANRAKGDQ